MKDLYLTISLLLCSSLLSAQITDEVSAAIHFNGSPSESVSETQPSVNDNCTFIGIDERVPMAPLS